MQFMIYTQQCGSSHAGAPLSWQRAFQRERGSSKNCSVTISLSIASKINWVQRQIKSPIVRVPHRYNDLPFFQNGRMKAVEAMEKQRRFNRNVNPRVQRIRNNEGSVRWTSRKCECDENDAGNGLIPCQSGGGRGDTHFDEIGFFLCRLSFLFQRDEQIMIPFEYDDIVLLRCCPRPRGDPSELERGLHSRVGSSG